MAREVEYADGFGAWYADLDEDTQDTIIAAVDHLEQSGPALGRPFVDTVKASRHPNMKELRPASGNVRVLFAFDPRRIGDPADRWGQDESLDSVV